MSYFDDPLRPIAKASKLRDWDTIDAVLEDLRVQGRLSVISGFRDAKKALGEEQRLERVHDPDAVTIHDLPSLQGIVIINECGVLKWRRKQAS